jgi:putative glycosyltransferase (TIGR04372 family)
MTPESLTAFWHRQWRLIRAGGWPVCKSKARQLLKRLRPLPILIVTAPIFVIPVIVIRLIRPWILLRFGWLESEGIGHFSRPVEIYLSEADLGLHDPGQAGLDIWYLNKIVCNHVLKDKWSQVLTIWPRQIAGPIDRLNRFIPGGARHTLPYRYIQERSTPWQNIDLHHVLERTVPHLSFSASEEAIGVRALHDMGFCEQDDFVCFMVRDGAYFGEDHHLRWQFRNTSPRVLMPAMEWLADLNCGVVRMGAKVSEALPASSPLIVDYAANGMRTELLDLFLIARCRFMVSTGTGVDALTTNFRRPLVHANVPQFGFEDELGPSVIFTPKHFWSKTEKRMLTFDEIFQRGAHLYTLQAQYDESGIESVNNTPEEIVAVVSEMEQRVAGQWVGDDEDEILQNRFRAIWPLRPNSRPLQARIGAEFLRERREWLT